MKHIRIKRIEISHFRGIAKEIKLDFFEENNNKTLSSILLIGDNGTGKSSIVDAIELALQGHVEQSKFARGTRHNYSIKSLASDDLPRVKVHLSDESCIHRFVIQDDDGMLMNSVTPHPLFSVSPFVIRRKDILRFWDTPETERQLVFWNYLRKSRDSEWRELLPEQLNRLQMERLELRVERDRLRLEIAKKLNIQIESVPFTQKELGVLIEDSLFLGLSPEMLRQRGIKVKPKFDINELEELAVQFIDKAKQHSSIKSEIKSFSVVRELNKFPTQTLKEMNNFLKGVEERLTQSFKEVSTISFIDKFTCSYGEVGALVLFIEVHLKNGQTCLPQHVLSEANLDLLALLFFVSLAEESYSKGQAPFLILDDVLQSVDSTIRFSFMDYLLKKFTGWQFVITVHDRLWQSQLKTLLNQHKFPCLEHEIYRWSFNDGPKIRLTSSIIGDSLRHAVEEAQHARICSEAGLILEQVCNQLSINLPISVIRRKDERYTLGDLWPGIYKTLGKTNLSEIANGVNKWIHLRNLVGAHYNEWAMSLSWAEAEMFGQAVLDLVTTVYCSNCFRWIESSNKQNSVWECRCGKLKISRK